VLNREEDRRSCREVMVQKTYFKYGSMHQPSNITRCKKIVEREPRLQCAALMALLTAIQSDAPELCDRMPAGQEEAGRMCKNYFRPSQPGTEAEYAEAVEILMHENVLLTRGDQDEYRNVAKQLGVGISAWSWNARFVDLDNDEWQDIYIVNGTWLTERGTPQKFFFHNQAGERFDERTDLVLPEQRHERRFRQLRAARRAGEPSLHRLQGDHPIRPGSRGRRAEGADPRDQVRRGLPLLRRTSRPLRARLTAVDREG
jgi:hypothetical protein